jgi:hypothetical protein
MGVTFNKRRQALCPVLCVQGSSDLHPKLRNMNLHNVTHSLISWNSRERMFVVQISLLIVTFFSLISEHLSLMQTTKDVNPHPHIAPCVSMWSVTFFLFFFFFFYFLCHLSNIGACVHHIVWEGKVEWATLNFTMRISMGSINITTAHGIRTI